MVVGLVGRIVEPVGNGPQVVGSVVVAADAAVVVGMGRRIVGVVAARQLVSPIVADASLVLARISVSAAPVAVAPAVAIGPGPEPAESEPASPTDVVARKLEHAAVEHRSVEPRTDDVVPLHSGISRPIADGRPLPASVAVVVACRPSSFVVVGSRRLEVFSFSSFALPSFVACTYVPPLFVGIVGGPPSFGIAQSHLDEVGDPNW